MSESSFILTAKDIYKSYQTLQSDQPLVVLDGVSLQIPPAKIISIVGSSGSGKSTLLHILGGLDKADYGDVFWENSNLASKSSDDLATFRNENIGFVFQFHHLLPEFTALENVCMPGSNRRDGH